MLNTLSKDSIMATLIQQYGKLTLEDNAMCSSNNLFQDLVTIVIRQQLSNKIALTICQRVETLLNGEIFPVKILAVSDIELKKTGLSSNKINYIKNIAYAIQNGSLKLEEMHKYSEPEVRLTLTKIKGIGQWSTDMFLIFSLRFPNIFSFGDAGLIKAVQNLYGKNKMLSKEQIYAISEKWKPFRSYACLYLWKSLET